MEKQAILLVSVQGINITVKSKNVGSVDTFPNEFDKMAHFKHVVSVTVRGKEDIKRTRFDFYSSYNDYISNKVEMDYSDLIDAFNCFLMDANAGGENDFHNFCSEFGYDEFEDRARVRKIYRGCVQSFEKVKRIGLWDFTSELPEILDEMQKNARNSE